MNARDETQHGSIGRGEQLCAGTNREITEIGQLTQKSERNARREPRRDRQQNATRRIARGRSSREHRRIDQSNFLVGRHSADLRLPEPFLEHRVERRTVLDCAFELSLVKLFLRYGRDPLAGSRKCRVERLHLAREPLKRRRRQPAQLIVQLGDSRIQHCDVTVALRAADQELTPLLLGADQCAR